MKEIELKIKEIKKKPDGTYAGMKFSKETTSALTGFVRANHIPNVLPSKDMHATLLYSKKYLPDYHPLGKLDEPLIGKPTGFEIFKSQPNDDGETDNCLVLRFDCSELSERFDFLMKEHGATFDYDEYKPHLTVSYSVGQLKPEDLPKFDKDIIMNEEYGKDLDLNWAKKKTK